MSSAQLESNLVLPHSINVHIWKSKSWQVGKYYDAFRCFMLKRQYEIKLSLLGKSILKEKLSPNLEKYSQRIKYNYIPFFGICFSTLLSEHSAFGVPQSSSFHKDFQTGNVA